MSLASVNPPPIPQNRGEAGLFPLRAGTSACRIIILKFAMKNLFPSDGRILIRSANWIGDAVMSTAALRELRRLFPRSHLTVVARQWVAPLFEEQGLADAILPLPNSVGALRQALTLSGRLRGFDAAVLFQNAFSAALTVFLARIPERVGYRTDGRSFLLTRRARPRVKRLGRHQVYHYLDLLHQTGLSPLDYLNAPSFQPDTRLQATERGRNRARKLLKGLDVDPDRQRIIVNPGAYYGPAKRWFIDRYAKLCDLLIAEHPCEILLIGSARERRIADEIAALTRKSPHILSGRTDLSCLMALIAGADLMITNDSGPMHLAAALGTRQIALFGSTDEIATGPLSDRAQVLHKHVPCSPCLLRECPIDLRCFDRISVEEVYRMASSALGAVSSRG